MNRLKRFLCILFYCGLFTFLPTLSWGDGYKTPFPFIPKTVVIEETGDLLNLQGIGIVKTFFKEDYAVAWYALQRLTAPQQIINDLNAKRISLYFLSRVDNFKEILEEGINQNNSAQVKQQEQINISQFIKMIDQPMQSGDVLILDFIPKQGTKVMINGKFKGFIKSNEFYPLVLKIWMGPQPPSKKFRKDLLNFS